MALREILANFGITVETAELERGNKLTDDFKDKLLGFGKAVAGAFAISSIVSFSKSLINAADELRESAIALGLPAQQLQSLEFAASMAGVEVGELRGALAKFNKTAAESAGGKGASAEFKKLGVELKNTDGTIKTSGQLFEESGAAIGAIKDPIERAGVASKLFGRSYAKLMPLFSEGAEGFAKARAEAEALGIVFDDAFLEQSDEINDNLTKLKGGLRGIAIQALAPLLPLLVNYTQRSVQVIKQVIAWVKGTKLLQAITIGFAAKGVMALVRAAGFLVTKLGGWRALFMRLGAVILKTILPLLILEDIIVFLSGGKSAIGKGLDAAFGEGTQQKVRDFLAEVVKFFKLFMSAPDMVRAKFRELTDALSADFGSIGKFFGQLGESMVDVALFVVGMVTGGWERAGNKIIALWDGIALAGKILWTELKFAGLAVAAAISDAFGSMWNSIVDSAITAITKLAALAGKIPGFKGVAEGINSVGKDLAGARASTTAGAEVGALRNEARLGLAGEGDNIGARLTATAPVPASAPVTNNVNQTANVSVNVTGPVDGAAISKIRGAAKGGTVQGLNLKTAHAAGVQRGG